MASYDSCSSCCDNAVIADNNPILTGLNGSLLQIDHTNSSAVTSATISVSKNTRVRSLTWFFSLAVSIRSDSSYVSPSNFRMFSIQNIASKFQRNRLHAAEDTSIIRFSINTDAASAFSVGNVHVTQITGFISTEKQMRDNVVQGVRG